MTGQKLAEQGANRAAEHAGKEWIRMAIASTAAIALTKQSFTAEDAKDHLARHFAGHAPPDPRAWGAVFRKAARMGLIEPTGQYRKASNKTCHARPMAVWRRRTTESVSETQPDSMKTTLTILATLAFCYGSFRAGQHYARPVAVPLPVLATPPPDALGTLEWRAPMPPQHSKEPLRVSL